jgi:hypothetical protein
MEARLNLSVLPLFHKIPKTFNRGRPVPLAHDVRHVVGYSTQDRNEIETAQDMLTLKQI